MNDQINFLSWNGIIAICTFFSTLGYFVDWVLRKRHKERILSFFCELENKIASISIRNLQFGVAVGFVEFWNWAPRSIFEGIRLIVNKSKLFTVIYISFFFVFPFIPFISINKFEIWYLNALSLMAIALWFPLVLVGGAYETGSPDESSRKLLFGFYDFPVPAAIISSIFSIIALKIGIIMSDCSSSSYWFHFSNDSLVPLHAAALTIINFPFDLATILISFLLLKKFIKKQTGFILAALYNIFISFSLTALLYMTLKGFQPGTSSLIEIFGSYAHFLIRIVTFGMLKTDPDYSLIPLLLTTFVPVSLYMSIFIVLGFIISPLLRLSGYFCGLLSEKDKSPFFEISFVFSTLIIATKAASDWRWFTQILFGE